MLEFIWAVVHHSKYLLSDEFCKTPVIFPKAEGRKVKESEVADAEFN